MHHRDRKLFLEAFLDFETFGSLDIFEVNTPECRRNIFHGFDKLIYIGSTDLDIEDVNIGKRFEQQTFTFHYRFSGQSADITQSEHGCTIRYHRDEITFCGIFIGVFGIFFDCQTRLCDSRRISQCQIVLGTVGFCRDHLDFTGTSLSVITQSFFNFVFFVCVHCGFFIFLCG